MKFDIKITKEKAYELAIAMYRNKMYCYGSGNFDIAADEFSEILMALFNSDDPEKSCREIYQRLSNQMVW